MVAQHRRKSDGNTKAIETIHYIFDNDLYSFLLLIDKSSSIN